MDVAAHSASAVAPPRRRLPLARILFIVAGAALFFVAAGFAIRYVSATDFHQERAFRVLDEIGNQLDNLQRTLTNQLRLMPSQLAGRQCVAALVSAGEGGTAAKEAADCSLQQENYGRRLALRGPRASLARVEEQLYARACGDLAPGANQYAIVVRASRPSAPFTAFSCRAETTLTETPTSRRLNMIAFTGGLTETIESFISQSFFDEVLVALENGTVVASAPRRDAQQVRDVQLHAARPRRLGVTDVSDMLRRAVAGATDRDSAKTAPAALPAQPAVFTERLAGERYRVFVDVVRPTYGVYLQQSADQPAVRQDRLYLVGLKRDDTRADIANSIGPSGRFALTALVLLAFLIWPLANLRAKPPEDPISWMEAIACLISIVLVPAIVAVSAVWIWSYHGVLSWADEGAQVYAREVAASVRAELSHARHMLARYRPIYQPDGEAARGVFATSIVAPIHFIPGSDANHPLFTEAQVAACRPQLDNTCVLRAAAVSEGNPFGAWSPFVSVFATDSKGTRTGLRFTVYDAPIVKPDANFGAREYFSALQRNQGWAVREESDSYVAQRIFSGGDGARVLQIAAPRTCGGGASAQFCGIITGSLSLHSLSAAVSPPLLKFAVIDRRSGLVIFHSDDSRSLAENFFVETEHNPELQALATIGHSAGFKGYYVGAAHRFWHTPIEDAPWSVVTFYSLREVGDLPWHAVLTALAAYSGAMLVILAVSGAALWLWFKRNQQGVRNFPARFWHRVGCACSYKRWGVSLFAAGTAVVTIYELSAGGGLSPITIAMWGVVAVAWIAFVMQHKRASHKACIALWLLLASAAPAAWMALGYYDGQVQGLLRDSLLDASHDIAQRRDAIAGDLRRWLSNDDGRLSAFPDPWVLTQPSPTMPVPGFAIGACDGKGSRASSADWVMCVFGPAPLATLLRKRDLDFWRRETWDAAAQAESQKRRIRLLGATKDANPECRSGPYSEQCRFRADGGQSFVVRIDLREDAGIAADDETRFDLATNSVLKALSLGAALAIPWLLGAFVERRLLGVRAAAHLRRRVPQATGR